MSITVSGTTYRTLRDDILVNGRKVTLVTVNGSKVYPDDDRDDDLPYRYVFTYSNDYELGWGHEYIGNGWRTYYYDPDSSSYWPCDENGSLVPWPSGITYHVEVTEENECSHECELQFYGEHGTDACLVPKSFGQGELLTCKTTYSVSCTVTGGSGSFPIELYHTGDTSQSQDAVVTFNWETVMSKLNFSYGGTFVETVGVGEHDVMPSKYYDDGTFNLHELFGDPEIGASEVYIIANGPSSHPNTVCVERPMVYGGNLDCDTKLEAGSLTRSYQSGHITGHGMFGVFGWVHARDFEFEQDSV